VSPERGFSTTAPELLRTRRDPMVMDLNIDFVAYMWIIGILMVLVAVLGYFVIGALSREHNRRREETIADAQSRQTWDGESPGSYGHG
jgi:hypothetical protein